MTHLTKANGTTVKLSDLANVTDDTTQYVAFTEPIYEKFSYKNDGTYERGRRLKWQTGDIIKDTDFNGYFTTATVTACTPNTGVAAGGDSVTLTGTDLSGTTVVTFGGSSATSVVVVDDETITCVTPAHSAGAVTVIVQAPAGNVSKATFYTYT